MKGRRLRFDFLKQTNLFLGICLMLSGSLWGQQLTILDEDNTPLEGVLVYAEDNSFHSISDSIGVVQLKENSSFPIIISYLGYVSQTLDKEELVKQDFMITLLVNDEILDEIVLIGRTNMASEDLAYETSIIQTDDILFSASQNSADALQNNSSVYVQKSQMGGGSPVIRGFEANKLLLVVDGVRMNNTIYRSGHLQNAITIDASILGSMEVIFGPGSLMYGSDALGGVIHFRSKEIELLKANEKAFNTNYYLRYGSSNEERTMHFDFQYKKKRWGALSSVTISDFNDLKIGRNRQSKYPENYGLRSWYVQQGNASTTDSIITNDQAYILRSTGYRQYDFLQKFKFQANEKLSFVWNNQFSTSSNIPRYDALTETNNNLPRYSSWEYGPQRRFLSSLTAKYIPENLEIADKIQWIIAYQNINEVRLTSFYKSSIIDEQNELLNLLNTTLDVTKTSGRHQFYYGLDANVNDLNSRAFQQEYAENFKTENGITRYPNGLGRSYSSGAYAQYYFLSGSWYKWNIGTRYDFNRVDIRFQDDGFFDWPDYFYDGVTNVNHALNGSIGFHATAQNGLRLRALVGSSFRSPNIDDIAKIRLNNDEISIPNDALRPEKSISSELTVSYKKDNFEYSVTGFHTYLTDAIVRQNFTLPSGETQYITANDTFQVVANVNAENAIIQGVSANIEHRLWDQLILEGSINFLQGRTINEGEADQPLAHIPPTYGRLFLTYEQEKFQLRAGIRHNGFKPIESYGGSVDNPEFATANGSESWTTFHIMGEVLIHKSFTLQAGIDNVFDQFYVPFASGVPGAGRHISLTMKGSF